MAAEIICVGTELLLGDIVNTNAQYLALELAKLGIPHYYQKVVGDNVERLKKAIAIARERSSILILDDFGGVCDGSKEEVMLGHTLLCLIMINYCYIEES